MSVSFRIIEDRVSYHNTGDVSLDVITMTNGACAFAGRTEMPSIAR